MKLIICGLFLFIVCPEVFSQTSGLLWRKDLPSNFNSTLINSIYQGITTDTLGNIYVCYSLNGSDTSSSFISKISPNGQLLWKRTLLPNNGYEGLHTQFDYSSKLFIDNDQNLVFCVKGYDTVTNNELLLFKFDLNGNLISKGGISNIRKVNNWDDWGVIVDSSNGNIYMPLCHVGIDTLRINIYCFDKNFNYQFTKVIDLTKATLSELPFHEYIHISIIDSLVLLQATRSNPDYSFFQAVNLYNDSVQFNYTDNRFIFFSNCFKVGNNYVLAGGSGIMKFNLNGVKLFEYLDDTRAPYYCNGKVFYASFTFDSLFNIVNSYDKIYHVFTDSISFQLTALPNVNNAISWYFFSNNNQLYSCGVVGDSNESRTIFFAKYDTLGNLSDYFFSTIPQSTWVLDWMTYCIDKNNDFIVFETVRKPSDSTSARFFDYILKASFSAQNNINGNSYYDFNSNCLDDSNEIKIPQNIVQLLPEDIYTTTDDSGHYGFSKLSGSGTIKIFPMFDVFLCDTMYNVIGSNSTVYNDLDFGYSKSEILHCKTSIHNLRVRPGFQTQLICYVHNNNFVSQYNIPVEIKLDTVFQFQGSSHSPDSVVGSVLYFHVDSLAPLEAKRIDLTAYVPPSIPIGYNYTHISNIVLQNDSMACSSTDTTSGIVVGAYDPNDKIVEPKGRGSENMISNDVTLKYTIRFQNTGTDTAFNVRIFDQLDEDLDIQSLRILGQSHPNTFNLRGRQLEFYFNDIYLPDSNTNQLYSNGFVSYSIKPKHNRNGKKILNKADIYFDYNTPVTTNTTSLTIGNYIEPTSFAAFNLVCYPNPNLNGTLTHQLSIDKLDHYSLIITDMMGRIIKGEFTDRLLEPGVHYVTSDLNDLTSGVYIVSFYSKTQKLKLSKKFVIAK